MDKTRRSKVISELAVATTVVSAVPCGLVSIILTGDSTNAASIKLYDHAATATGAVKKMLAIKTEGSAVYCPCKADAFSVGCVAVVAGTGALGYISIEPV